MGIVLETPRLILTEFTAADGPLILHLNSDPDVVSMLWPGSNHRKLSVYLLNKN